ncbi:MAG: hypothetical protein AB7F98_19390 [Novosphingobium sp.]
MLVPGLSQAQAPTKAQQDAIRSNCRSDFMANCSSVTPGGREALECLMKHKASLSGGCQGALNAISAPAPAAAKPEPKPEPKAEPAPSHAPAAAAPHPHPQAPEAPKAPPPAAAKPVAPKAAKAPAHPAAPPPAGAAAPPPPATAAVPPPADAAPAAPRPMRIGEAIMIRRFCANDFKVLCKGVPLGQGRAVQCLASNRDALSPGCKQAMAQTGH